jgi:hypothetical protein
MKLWAPRVVVVATHADLTPSAVESEKTKDAIERLMRTYSADLLIERHLFTLDANQAMGAEMKQLRQTISDIKKFICEVRIEKPIRS